jgi:hypothetical protein
MRTHCAAFVQVGPNAKGRFLGQTEKEEEDQEDQDLELVLEAVVVASVDRRFANCNA